jgi:hypothetical protein
VVLVKFLVLSTFPSLSNVKFLHISTLDLALALALALALIVSGNESCRSERMTNYSLENLAKQEIRNSDPTLYLTLNILRYRDNIRSRSPIRLIKAFDKADLDPLRSGCTYITIFLSS